MDGLRDRRQIGRQIDRYREIDDREIEIDRQIDRQIDNEWRDS